MDEKQNPNANLNKNGQSSHRGLYYMTIIDENVFWMKLAYLLSFFFSKPHGPLLYIYINFEVLDSLSKRTK